MDAVEALFLAAAAFAGGAINAVAGGGSLVSFPALVAVGYPAKVANVTNTVALWPGYVGGTVGYRRELAVQRRRAVALSVSAVAGALAGSFLLLATGEDSFDSVVPYLILFACAVMALQDPLSSFATRHQLGAVPGAEVPLLLHGLNFLLAIYGAYFGGGLGIITLAALTILLPDDIQHSNALKGYLSLVINGVAVVCFGLFGPVEWGPAAVMAAGALAGGYLGVGVARRLGKRWLRVAVVTYGVAAAIILIVT